METLRRYLSIFIDVGVMAITWFAALAFGANELWAMSILSIAAFALLVGRVCIHFGNGRIAMQSSWLYICLILFLALVAAQALFWNRQIPDRIVWLPHTVERYSTLSYLTLAAAYAAIIAAVQMGFRSRDALKKLVIGLLGLGVFEAAYGIIQYVGNYDYIWNFSKRAYQGLATGTFINRNHYALFLNIVICVGVGFVFYRSQRLLGGRKPSIRSFLSAPGFAKLVWIVAMLAIMGLAVVFSMSRTGIVAMFCSIGVMIVSANAAGVGRRGGNLGILLLIAVLGLAIYTGVDPVLERYENISKERGSDQDRVALWRDAWKMVEAHPVFGQGLGTFQWTFPAHETVEPDLPARYAHNDYLQIFAETGIVGLALLLCLLVAVGRIALKNLRNVRDPLVAGIGLGTIGALSAIALQEITDFGLYIPGVAVLAALIVGLNLRARSLA